MTTVLSRTPSSLPADRTPVPRSPRGERPSRSRLRDPRLAIGVALVALCAVAGARLLASADDFQQVWAIDADLAAGSRVQSQDLRAVRVRFGSDELADRYVVAGGPAAQALRDGAVLDRPLKRGELLPRGALTSGPADRLTALALGVPAQSLPAGTGVGDVVDVWVAPREGRGDGLTEAAEAVRALRDVRVLSIGGNGDGLDPTSTRQVVVGVGHGDLAGLPVVIGLVAQGTVVLTTTVGS